MNGTFNYESDAREATHINYGLMLVQRNLIQHIKKEAVIDFSNVIQSLSREKKAICAVTESALFEVGSFEGILELENHLEKSKNELHKKTP
jgi:hypothetical protein